MRWYINDYIIYIVNMGNIITFTSQQVFGLDQKVLAQTKKREEIKIFLKPKSVVRGKSLYSFIRKS